MAYKIYNAEEYDNLDLSLVQLNIRWSIDRSKFIVHFIEEPDCECLTKDEARAIMLTPEWSEIQIDFGAIIEDDPSDG